MSVNDVLLQKFMDCKLSDDERTELEKQLTEDELTRLKNDKAFQDALAEKLKNAPCCPDPLWDKLKSELMGEAVAENSGNPPPRWLSLAAVLAVCLGLLALIIFNQPGRNGKFVSNVFLIDDVEEYARQADVHGSHSALLKNLHRNGFKSITFGDQTVVDGHSVIPLGIRYQTFKKERVAQILFDCCSNPVVIVVAPKDLPIDPAPLQFSDDAEGSMKQLEIGGYKIIAGAQNHTCEKALKLFSSVDASVANVR